MDYFSKPITEEMLNQLFEEAKKKKSVLKSLLKLAKESKQHELVAQLKIIEADLFPKTKEEEEAEDLTNLFAMVKLNIPESISWLISETLKAYGEKGKDFSLVDAARLLSKNKEIFD